MKITFVLADISSIGGIERVSSILTDTFAKHGHDVSILSLFQAHQSINYNINPDVSVVSLTKKQYAVKKAGGFSRLAMLISVVFKLRSYLRKQDCGMIISHGLPVNVLIWLCGFANRAIACEHVNYDRYNKLIKTIRTSIYKHFFLISVLTSNDYRKYQSRLSNVVQIPNPLPEFSTKSADLSAKRIICVGRLTYSKGYDMLLKVLPEVFERFPDWKLCIYGEGILKNDLEELKHELHLDSNVFFMGTTSDIYSEYLKSSLFVLSSRYEGFGMVLIEAASCGLPIISFDCPEGPSDILKDDRGILVKANDIDALKDAIIKMLSDSDMRKEYGRRAKDISYDYLPEAIYKSWSSVFEKYNSVKN